MLRARRAALVQQRDAALAEHAEVEALLRTLTRQIDAMNGGVEAYDALLELAEGTAPLAKQGAADA